MFDCDSPVGFDEQVVMSSSVATEIRMARGWSGREVNLPLALAFYKE
jgi:hypothetical protein